MEEARGELAGPGPGDYAELEKELPRGYETLLGPKDTQIAIAEVKRIIEEGLCRELGLIRVQVPLIVDAECGVNDYLDRDGSRTPVRFHISIPLRRWVRGDRPQSACIGRNSCAPCQRRLLLAPPASGRSGP